MNSTSSPPEEMFNYTSWPNLVAATLMSINCILGCGFSGSIVYIFLKDNSQRNSFNFSCFVRALNNIGCLITAFVLVYVPKSILGYSLCPAWLESTLICISLNLYLFNEFQSIYISINRFVAIYFPTHYNKLCGIWATVIIHLALFGNRLQNVVFETYERIKHENYISFSPDYLMFTAIEVGGTGMVVLFSLMFIVALSANIATFAKISIFYLKSGGNQDADNQRRVRMNIKLFFQTALQDFLFLLDNFFTFKLGGLINHRFWIFICATFVWQSVHVLDGLIMIMFNDRLSFLKKSLFTSSEAISKADSNSTFVKTWPNRTTNRDISS